MIEVAFLIGMFVLFVVLHAILLTIPFRGKTETEMEEINKATEEWIKAHPIVSFCFFFLPPLLVILFFVTFKPGVKDSREVDYSSFQKEILHSVN